MKSMISLSKKMVIDLQDADGEMEEEASEAILKSIPSIKICLLEKKPMCSKRLKGVY